MFVRVFTFFVAGIFLSGCVFNQTVTLGSSGVIAATTHVSITDARSEDERQTELNVTPCFRKYGDKFITPSKVEFLRSHLSRTIKPDTPLKVVIQQYETVEECEESTRLAAAIAGAAASAAAAASITGQSVSYRVRGPASQGEDHFKLVVAGTVNAKPFRYTKSFVHTGMRYTNFPSENAEYRQRMLELFDGLSKHLVAAANGSR